MQPKFNSLNQGAAAVTQALIVGTDFNNNQINFTTTSVPDGSSKTFPLKTTSGQAANGLNLASGGVTTAVAEAGILTIYALTATGGVGAHLKTVQFQTVSTNHPFTFSSSNLCYGVEYNWTSNE